MLPFLSQTIVLDFEAILYEFIKSKFLIKFFHEFMVRLKMKKAVKGYRILKKLTKVFHGHETQT